MSRRLRTHHVEPLVCSRGEPSTRFMNLARHGQASSCFGIAAHASPPQTQRRKHPTHTVRAVRTKEDSNMSRLVVVSNRVATPTETKGSAGGLAVGVFGALKDSGGVWFGWSGDVVSESVANSGPTLDAGRRRDLRDRRPAEEGLRPVLPRLFERDALAGLPLSQRSGRLRPRGICRLSPRQFVARAQGDQAAGTRRHHLGPRLSPDSVRRGAALRRRDESHGIFPAHSVSVAANPAQHSAARGTREVAVLL